MSKFTHLSQKMGLLSPFLERQQNDRLWSYQGVEKRPDANADITWHVARRPDKRKALNKDNEAEAMIDKAEKLKAGIRAKVKHPFRVIKRQFGFLKVRHLGPKKNTAQLLTLFALSNLWMVRGKLMGVGA